MVWIWNLPLLILYSTSAWAQDSLRLYYYERPPYMISGVNGSVSGLSADRVKLALNKAGIPFHWEKLPAKRQLRMLQAKTENSCAVGWYKTPERETFAQFSKPIFSDKAPVLIARYNFQPPPRNALKELLANPQIRILMKEGLTYGHYILTQMQHSKATITTVTLEQDQMLEMIAADRADFMFATREEAEYALKRESSEQKRFKIISFIDIPGGEPRYLMCSQALSPDQLKTINGGINALPHQP